MTRCSCRPRASRWRRLQAATEGITTRYGLILASDLPDTDGAWLVSAGRLVAPIRFLDGVAMRHDPGWTDRLQRWSDPLAR